MKRFLLTTTLLFAFSASASIDVHVTFRIDVPMMATRYADPVAVQNQIAEAIVGHLRRQLPQWQYTAVAPGANDYTLAFHVDARGGRHVFHLALRKGARTYKTWDAVWLEPGELGLQGGYPDRRSVAQEIGARVAEKLLQPPDAIFDQMKAVPLATTGKWLNPRGRQEDLRMVLPLRWEDSKVLVKAIMRIECEGSTTLRSEALDDGVDYPDPPRPSFKGLVVKPLVRIIGEETVSVRSAQREVRALKPIAVFLESISPLGMHMAEEQKGGR